jgi:agmatine/peptidylarginine deiminase
MRLITLPAEWVRQSGIILAFPHMNSDWNHIFSEVVPCFVSIVKEIIKREQLIILCFSIKEVKFALGSVDYSKIIFCKLTFNDVWVRDYGPLFISVDDRLCILDFNFNGWGLKFPANHDNQIVRCLYEKKIFSSLVDYKKINMVLEGGSIESDGNGSILTTSRCLLSINRNEFMTKSELEHAFNFLFGIKRVLWLHNGYLAGDDTDAHIDTLARFCDRETIVYVQCTNKNDEHFEELSLMEEELMSFKTLEGKPYKLIPLPMAEAVFYEGERLPATYANFLIINDVVLMPIYDSYLDELAKTSLQKAFFGRNIIGINCLPLIKQHGSLHCLAMQIPENFILLMGGREIV